MDASTIAAFICSLSQLADSHARLNLTEELPWLPVRPSSYMVSWRLGWTWGVDGGDGSFRTAVGDCAAVAAAGPSSSVGRWGREHR